MTYEQIEQEVVARLQDKMPTGVEVAEFAESDSQLVKPFENAHISVLYKGSRFGEPGQNLRSTAQVSQLETVQLEIIVRSRFLRGQTFSCMNLLKELRKALLGFRPTDCHRMYGVRSELVIPSSEEPSDIFTYICSFETSTLAVEEFDQNDGDGAPIEDIVFNPNL